MQAKKNHILFLCILLTRAPWIHSEQTSELEPETHNQEFELNETIEEQRKERKIDHPTRTNTNKYC